MAPSATLAAPPPATIDLGREARAFLRHNCDLPTTCQPVAARGPNEPTWDARILNISAGGIALAVIRRFERGTGLSVDIPEEGDYLGDTLVVRVVHLRPFPEGGWLLGCAFVSHLSEDTVRRLVQLKQANRIADSAPEAEPPAPEPVTAPEPVASANGKHSVLLTRVVWRNRETGQRLRIGRLFAGGPWPLRPQTTIRLSVKNRSGQKSHLPLLIHGCQRQGDTWIVDYSAQSQQ